MRTMLACLGITAVLMTASATPARAEVTLDEYFRGTGESCLVGGVIAGAAAGLLNTPVAATGIGTVPAGGVVTASALMGCGLGAVAATTFFTGKWVYDNVLAPPRYPMLYPPR